MPRRKKFVLHLVSKEVTTASLEVEAENEAEAKELFNDGDVDMNAITLDESPTEPLWEIESVEKEVVKCRHCGRETDESGVCEDCIKKYEKE